MPDTLDRLTAATSSRYSIRARPMETADACHVGSPGLLLIDQVVNVVP